MSRFAAKIKPTTLPTILLANKQSSNSESTEQQSDRNREPNATAATEKE